MGLNSMELEVLTKLISKYGKDITLGEILGEQISQPINEVVFTLEIVHVNSCGVVEDTYEQSGTIEEILSQEFGVEIRTKENGIHLMDVLTESNINELADYFLGNGKEDYTVFREAVQSREVTHDEVVEYLKALYVDKLFYCESTIDRVLGE